MTIIVGIPHKDKVYLGADAQCTAGYVTRIDYEGKVWRQGSYVLGLTGSPREDQIIRYATKLPDPDPTRLHAQLCTDFVAALRAARKEAGYDEKATSGIEQGPCCMVGVAGRLFVVWGDYQVGEYPEGTAVGSGGAVALGALHATAKLKLTPSKRIELALAAACAHDIYCAPPFTFAEV